MQKWQNDNTAECFAVLDESAIGGMSSLSHRDNTIRSAGIGKIWDRQRFQGRCVCSAIFDQMIAGARELGLTAVEATVHKEDKASLSI